MRTLSRKRLPPAAAARQHAHTPIGRTMGLGTKRTRSPTQQICQRSAHKFRIESLKRSAYTIYVYTRTHGLTQTAEVVLHRNSDASEIALDITPQRRRRHHYPTVSVRARRGYNFSHRPWPVFSGVFFNSVLSLSGVSYAYVVGDDHPVGIVFTTALPIKQ